MLSVGSRAADVRGFGTEGMEEEEENELEEGEACSDHEDAGPVDPDTAYSYIDEKIKDVLGHFQKDFEGVVSYEELGSKFGTYGSFLPMYPRSPMISTQPRSPQKARNSNLAVSQINSQSENAVLSNSLASVKKNCSFAPPSLESSAKKDLNRSSLNAPNGSSTTSSNDNDLKTLKVRIRVGSENATVRTNTDIYSGLGLEMSPSLSPEGSPYGGFSPGAGDDPFGGSPLALFQFYSRFYAPNLVACLLSPIPENLCCLMEKKIAFLGDCSMNDINIVKKSKEFSAKGRKYVEKSSHISETKSLNGKNELNYIIACPKKEASIEPLEERISSAHNTRILSMHTNAEELPMSGSLKDVDICMESGEISENKESPESIKRGVSDTAVPKIGRSEVMLSKGKTTIISSSGENVTRHARSNVSDDLSHNPKKIRRSNANNSSDLSLVDSERQHELKPRLVSEPTKSRNSQNTHPDVELKTSCDAEKSSSSKSKSKGEQAGDVPSAQLLKEDAAAEFRASSKEKKKSLHLKTEVPESKFYTLKPIKEPDKSSNGDRVINTGPPTFQQGEDAADGPVNLHKRVPDDNKFYHKKHGFEEKPKDKARNKNTDAFSASGASNMHSQDASVINNCLTSDEFKGHVGPVLINENWVCCDKCHVWRLLPYDMKPSDLPKKWLCSMQTWLPGMNSCAVSEKETTAALNALYHLPPADSQHTTTSGCHEISSGVKVVESRQPQSTFNQNSPDSQGLAKKKFIAGNASQDHGQLGLGRSMVSAKEIPLTAAKSRSLSEVNGFSKETEIQVKSGSQCTSKSTDFKAEKSKHKHKEKQYLLDGDPEEGDFIRQKMKKSKPKSKRDSAEDDLMISKKIKSKDPRAIHDQTNHELNQSGPLCKVPDKQLFKQDYTSKRDSKFEHDEPKKKMKAPLNAISNGEMLDHHASYDDAKLESVKKRKMKEQAESRTPHQSDTRFEEKASDSLHRKEKKIKSYKFDGKTTNTHMSEQLVGKKSLVTRIPLPSSREQLLSGLDREDINRAQLHLTNTDGSDTLKREYAYSLNSNAATSSSSKISGSHKSKTDRERKGSPVESVSSSPLRNSSAVRVTTKVSTRRMSNGGNSTMESPERYEGDSLHETEPKREEKTTSTIQMGSLEINRPLEPRDHMANLQGKETHHLPESNAKDLLFANIFGSTDDEASPSHDEAEMRLEVDKSSEQENRYTEKSQWKDNDHYHERHLPEGYSRNLQSSAMKSNEKTKMAKNDISRSKFKGSNSFGDKEDFGPVQNAGTNFNDNILSHEDIRDGYSHHLKDRKKKLTSTNGKKPSKEKEKTCSSSRVQVIADSSSLQTSKCKVLNSNAGGHSIVYGTGGSSSNQENFQTSLIVENEKSSRRFFLSKDKPEIKCGPTSEPVSALVDNKEDMQTQPHSKEPALVKGSRGDVMPSETGNGDASKLMKEPQQLENQNERHKSNLKHMTSNGADLPATSRKGSNQSAAHVVKEATDLKHTANRLKQLEGSESESTALYFQAALKFLHGAFLLEPSNSEGARQGSMAPSIQMYSETAKLCEFCAHAYERQREMAAAALAYKCMEVAYLKVVYSKHSGALKDCMELQTALPIGESPSSSASDVDNPNGQAKLNKAASCRAVSSPQVIAARNRSNFDQILAFAEYVNSAMEASRRALNAFSSANADLVNGQSDEGIQSVRGVLDFSFHNVEGLLRQVRLSMELITK